jgi:hypothetical protein
MGCPVPTHLHDLALQLLQLGHPLLNRTRRHEASHRHRPSLPQSVHAIAGLLLDGRVPPRVHEDHVVGGRQVQADTARLERDQKHDRLPSSVPSHRRSPLGE